MHNTGTSTVQNAMCDLIENQGGNQQDRWTPRSDLEWNAITSQTPRGF